MMENGLSASLGLPLSELKEGQEGVIRSIGGGRNLSARLAALGIVPGVRVTVLQSPGGLCMIEVGDTRVALGHGEIEKILVIPQDAAVCAPPPEERERRRFLVALAGQPNVGKSTVFNILTGLSQHVGNWPGKTVEKKEGLHECGAVTLRIVDLPGTYSLTAFSEEERVARDFILTEDPDIIVLIVSAAALERGLYLLAELLLLQKPVILAVNMIDVAQKRGIRINIRSLHEALGIPVVAMTATRNEGIRELVDRVLSFLEGGEAYRPTIPLVAPDHRDVFEEVEGLLQRHLGVRQGKDLPPTKWLTTKLMEGDPEIAARVEAHLPPDVWGRIRNIFLLHEDALHAVVGGRYDWIEAVTRAAVSRFQMGQVVFTDRIDHILTRPVFGIPFLLAVFAFVFFVTYRIGYPVQRLIEDLMGRFLDWAQPLLSTMPGWVRGLLTDGVIGGVGSVLTLLPVLVIFFVVMAVLEDVGYMARAAFVMDRFMHLIGLHGKSVIPLCLGLGCNVPAVLGARIVESRREKLLTILLSPFVPCSARLAVLTLVSGFMFPAAAAVVSWSLVAVNFLVLGLAGMAVKLLLKKEEPMPFIMELPLYHKPDPRTIGTAVWIRTLAFVKKAGTVILAVSIGVWFLSYLPSGRVEESLLAVIGRSLEPLGAFVGLDWKMITALLTGLIAKENAVATLGILYGVGKEGLAATMPAAVGPASALAFLTVLMLFLPCAATAAVMAREMEDRRWFAASFLLMLVVSLAAGAAAYRVGLLIWP